MINETLTVLPGGSVGQYNGFHKLCRTPRLHRYLRGNLNQEILQSVNATKLVDVEALVSVLLRFLLQLEI